MIVVNYAAAATERGGDAYASAMGLIVDLAERAQKLERQSPALAALVRQAARIHIGGRERV
jgi:hypothetical protein